MVTQVLELTGLGGEGWSGAALIDPALIEGGGTAYLRFIRRIGNNFQVRLSATATADPENVGPEFTEAFETADSAFTFAAGGSTLVLKGPGNADNSFADASEPYFWSPDNGAAMSSWFASAVGDFTLTLTDGRPDVAVHAVRGAAAAGGAETRARIDVVPALALSDFDGRGLEFDVLALIRAGSGSGGTIYASPPRAAVGALLDGELGLGADEAAITRIRRRNGTMLAINDNDPLSLAAYFSPGGAGADLTLYIQTQDGVASFPVSDHGREGGNMIQFGPLAAGLLSLIDDIADGERFIFALARPARTVVETRGVAEAGAPQARARVLRVTPAIGMVRGTAAAGVPHAAARLLALPVRTLHGSAAAGGAEARARLDIAYIRALRGLAAAGRARVSARIQRVRPADIRYQRALREVAPADRLLTALEISHPAIAQPLRVINDTIGRAIEGNDYVALRFDARLADDIAGQAPQAELAIDNVGRALTQWIEATGGGAGASVRVMQVLDIRRSAGRVGGDAGRGRHGGRSGARDRALGLRPAARPRRRDPAPRSADLAGVVLMFPQRRALTPFDRALRARGRTTLRASRGARSRAPGLRPGAGLAP